VWQSLELILLPVVDQYNAARAADEVTKTLVALGKFTAVSLSMLADFVLTENAQ
jgi:hypothetical protein